MNDAYAPRTIRERRFVAYHMYPVYMRHNPVFQLNLYDDYLYGVTFGRRDELLRYISYLKQKSARYLWK